MTPPTPREAVALLKRLEAAQRAVEVSTVDGQAMDRRAVTGRLNTLRDLGSPGLRELIELAEAGLQAREEVRT